MGRNIEDNAYLLIKFGVGGFELLLKICAGGSGSEVIRELNLREGLTLSSLAWGSVDSCSVRNGTHRCRLVLDISNFIKMHMRDLFVLNDGRVVRGSIPRQLREVL